MKNRNFEEWLGTFKDSISDYRYYIDFEKVIENVEIYKVELNILNALIASKDIENDFSKIVSAYPNVLKCIPTLLAVRDHEIHAMDANGDYNYNFNLPNQDIDQYLYFMRETGLFGLLENHIINNLYDYATGVEVGLNTNARKNRGGHLMENLLESYLIKAGLPYYKELTGSEIKSRFNLDIAKSLNDGKTTKRFDFVVPYKNYVVVFETNFYKSSGSKLNETARSYKQLNSDTKKTDKLMFVWITDGRGWNSAKGNLQETFEDMEYIFNINDLNNDVLEDLFNHIDSL